MIYPIVKNTTSNVTQKSLLEKQDFQAYLIGFESRRHPSVLFQSTSRIVIGMGQSLPWAIGRVISGIGIGGGIISLAVYRTI